MPALQLTAIAITYTKPMMTSGLIQRRKHMNSSEKGKTKVKIDFAYAMMTVALSPSTVTMICSKLH